MLHEAHDRHPDFSLCLGDHPRRRLVGAFLFAAVERLEPNRRFAIIFKCAILAAGEAVIAKQLLP